MLTATQKRRERKRRATARNLWYKVRSGQIVGSPAILRWILSTLKQHHSRDPSFLHRVRQDLHTARMAGRQIWSGNTEVNQGWKRWQCRRMNKKMAIFCQTCGQHWETCAEDWTWEQPAQEAPRSPRQRSSSARRRTNRQGHGKGGGKGEQSNKKGQDGKGKDGKGKDAKTATSPFAPPYLQAGSSSPWPCTYGLLTVSGASNNLIECFYNNANPYHWFICDDIKCSGVSASTEESISRWGHDASWHQRGIRSIGSQRHEADHQGAPCSDYSPWQGPQIPSGGSRVKETTACRMVASSRRERKSMGGSARSLQIKHGHFAGSGSSCTTGGCQCPEDYSATQCARRQRSDLGGTANHRGCRFVSHGCRGGRITQESARHHATMPKSLRRRHHGNLRRRKGWQKTGRQPIQKTAIGRTTCSQVNGWWYIVTQGRIRSCPRKDGCQGPKRVRFNGVEAYLNKFGGSNAACTSNRNGMSTADARLYRHSICDEFDFIDPFTAGRQALQMRWDTIASSFGFNDYDGFSFSRQCKPDFETGYGLRVVEWQDQFLPDDEGQVNSQPPVTEGPFESFSRTAHVDTEDPILTACEIDDEAHSNVTIRHGPTPWLIGIPKEVPNEAHVRILLPDNAISHMRLFPEHTSARSSEPQLPEDNHDQPDHDEAGNTDFYPNHEWVDMFLEIEMPTPHPHHFTVYGLADEACGTRHITVTELNPGSVVRAIRQQFPEQRAWALRIHMVHPQPGDNADSTHVLAEFTRPHGHPNPLHIPVVIDLRRHDPAPTAQDTRYAAYKMSPTTRAVLFPELHPLCLPEGQSHCLIWCREQPLDGGSPVTLHRGDLIVVRILPSWPLQVSYPTLHNEDVIYQTLISVLQRAPYSSINLYFHLIDGRSSTFSVMEFHPGVLEDICAHAAYMWGPDAMVQWYNLVPQQVSIHTTGTLSLDNKTWMEMLRLQPSLLYNRRKWETTLLVSGTCGSNVVYSDRPSDTTWIVYWSKSHRQPGVQ